MKIDEALKFSDVAISTLGTCVTKSNRHDWYHCGGHVGVYSLYELTGKFKGDTWKPACICQRFQIGEKVSFLQACLSGQCFVTHAADHIRRCVNLTSGKMLWYNDVEKQWRDSLSHFCASDIVTIVADSSQEQSGPEKRQRTYAEIVADIKTLVSELEEVK